MQESKPKTKLTNDQQKPKAAATKSKKASRPQKPARTPREWKQLIATVAFYVAWTLFSLYVGQVLVAYILGYTLGQVIHGTLWMLIAYIVIYAVSLSLLIFAPSKLLQLYRKRQQKAKSAKSEKNLTALEKDLTSTPESLGVQHLPTFVDIGLAPVGYFVYIVLASVFTNIMLGFSWYDADQAQDLGIGYFVTDLNRILAIVAVVLIAPIAEELIMRGWLYGKLRSKLGIVVSILITSVLFGFLHGQWNVAVATFAMSIVLCGLREITGTIWSGVLLHILANGIAFYISYIAF